ncbi:MAG: hypothetical protein IPL21_14540 [Saprospirales bacterium]|nr:hypothetical protein [Saprospirales bacterium]
MLKGYAGMGVLLAGAGLDLKAIKDNIAAEVFNQMKKVVDLTQWYWLLHEQKMAKRGF